MALPKLTVEQRKAALEKAALVRRQRAELKQNLKEGRSDFPRYFGWARKTILPENLR